MKFADKTPDTRHPRYRWYVLGIILVLFIIFKITFIFLRHIADESIEEANAKPQPALTVTVATPEVQNWEQSLTANGNIAAWQEAVIGSELSGQRLTQVNVNVGDVVKRGQILAEINSETIRADLAQAEANAAEAKAILADATANAKRILALKNTGAISQQEASQYLTSQQTAQAKLDAANAQIDANKVRLSQTQITAPDNGIISARTATVGSLTQSGQELLRMIRDSRLEWRAEITSSDLYRIQPGMTVSVTSPDPSAAPVMGTVRTISPTIDPKTSYALVYVDLPRTNALRMGMYVKGTFNLGQQVALTIPQSALVLRDGFAYVFTLDKQHRVHQLKVNVGRRDNDRVEVSNIPDQAQVIISGTGFLSDGDLVSVSKAIPVSPLTTQLANNQE